jgi:hypothetical protein
LILSVLVIAGAKLNEEAGILDIGYSFTSDATTGFNA